MTAPCTTASDTPLSQTTSSSTVRRRLLSADAALCAVAGLTAAVDAPAVADLLGPDVPTAVVRVVGVVLVLAAVDLALLSRVAVRFLRPALLAAGGVNLAWELATVVLVALGAFSTGGAALAISLAVVVGGLGLVQLRHARG